MRFFTMLAAAAALSLGACLHTNTDFSTDSSRRVEPGLGFNVGGGAPYTVRTTVELNFVAAGLTSITEYRADDAPDMSNAAATPGGGWIVPIAGTPATFTLPTDCRADPEWRCTVTVYFQIRGVPTVPQPTAGAVWESPIVSDAIELVFVHPDIEQLFADNPIVDGNGSYTFPAVPPVPGLGPPSGKSHE